MNFMDKFWELCRTVEKIEEHLNPKDHSGCPEEKPKEKCWCHRPVKDGYLYDINEEITVFHFCPQCGKKL